MAQKKRTNSRKIEKNVSKAVTELSKTKGGRVFLVVVAIILLVAVGFGVYWFYFRKQGQEAERQSYPDVSGQDISVHFLEFDSIYAGDCIYIKTQSCDILIDCGARIGNLNDNVDYLNHYATDGTLEYVIVTHAHQDHYAGFIAAQYTNTIFAKYTIGTLIDFCDVSTDTEENTIYPRYLANRQKALDDGDCLHHYTAVECINDSTKNGFDVGGGYTMTILDSYYYAHPDKSNENNNSVCTLFSNGTKHFLFTGDLEEDGEEKLIERNPSLPTRVDLFKAGHHGSYTASSQALLQAVNPKTIVVTCCAGSPEYTTNNFDNQFPSQTFISNVARYTTTDEVYVTGLYTGDRSTKETDKHTSFNGNIVYMAKGNSYKVVCSASSVKLKDSEWFKQNRTWA